MAGPQWSFGDRVIHAKRPEWGVGVVTAAQSVVEDGHPAQRVTIRFDRAGRVDWDRYGWEGNHE